MSTKTRTHSRKRSKSRGKKPTSGGKNRKRSTSRGKSNVRKNSKGRISKSVALSKSVARRKYRGGLEGKNDNVKFPLDVPIGDNVDILVVQDTFLIVSDYKTKQINYYTIEDNPNGDDTKYVFKANLNTYPLEDDEISNVVFIEINTEAGMKTFLFYFVGEALIFLEVQLHHNKEYVKNKGFIKCDCGKKRKYINYYFNNNLKEASYNICYLENFIDKGGIPFATFTELSVGFRESAKINDKGFDQRFYSIFTYPSKYICTNGTVYSFVFMPNNLISFLIKYDIIGIPEIFESGLEKYKELTEGEKKSIIKYNTRYFKMEKSYKLKYYHYTIYTKPEGMIARGSSNIVFFSTILETSECYSEIPDIPSEKIPKGMVYHNNSIYINFSNEIIKLRIPPECIFNHYLVLYKLGLWSKGVIENIKGINWRNFQELYDYPTRLNFVDRIEKYNDKNAGSAKAKSSRDKYYKLAKESKKNSIDEKLRVIDSAKKIKDDNEFNANLVKKAQEVETKRIRDKQAEEKAKRDAEEKAKRDAEEKDKKEAEEKTKLLGIKKGGDPTEEDIKKAKELLEAEKNSFGTKITNVFKKNDELSEKERANLYEPTEYEIILKVLQEQAILGSAIEEELAKGKYNVGENIINRYKNKSDTDSYDYNDKSWQRYYKKHENDIFNNYDYDFLYFEKSTIYQGGNVVGLVIYGADILSVLNNNHIIHIKL